LSESPYDALRCPQCQKSGTLQVAAGVEGVGSGHCQGCGHDLAVHDGIPDFAEHIPMHGDHPQLSPLQWLMNTRLFAAIYETPFWRPLHTRLGSGISMSDEVNEVMSFVEADRVACALDLACGTGHYARAMAQRFPQARIWGADISLSMLRRASAYARASHLESLAFYRGDIHRLPHDDASVDWANCGGALHLLPDPAAAWREIARILRPGGRFTAMVVVLRGGLLGRLQRWLMQRDKAFFFAPDTLATELASFGLADFRHRSHGGSMVFSTVRLPAGDVH
jgi:SAM-dependent methyltransferase